METTWFELVCDVVNYLSFFCDPNTPVTSKVSTNVSKLSKHERLQYVVSPGTFSIVGLFQISRASSGKSCWSERNFDHARKSVVGVVRRCLTTTIHAGMIFLYIAENLTRLVLLPHIFLLRFYAL